LSITFFERRAHIVVKTYMNSTPETDAMLHDCGDARRELQLLLESTKVETCSEPLPERDGEPADFSGAIRRMRLAEAERDQWRECAERISKALRCPCNFDERTCDRCEELKEEFNRLKGETK
jgi:hypothetical protein